MLCVFSSVPLVQLRIIGSHMYSSGFEAAAAYLHHALCMQMCTCYIAQFDRHSHLVTMLPMSSVVLVTTHGVMVSMQCVMVIMHALNMQVL